MAKSLLKGCTAALADLDLGGNLISRRDAVVTDVERFFTTSAAIQRLARLRHREAVAGDGDRHFLAARHGHGAAAALCGPHRHVNMPAARHRALHQHGLVAGVAPAEFRRLHTGREAQAPVHRQNGAARLADIRKDFAGIDLHDCPVEAKKADDSKKG